MAAHGPDWLGIWMPVLFGGAFILPLALLIWKPTRLAAIVIVLASFLGALSTNVLYSKIGYVKLLGLPHILLDFMAKLAALVPRPRTNLTGPPLYPWVQARFHGVLAPNSRYRESVTPLSARQVELPLLM